MVDVYNAQKEAFQAMTMAILNADQYTEKTIGKVINLVQANQASNISILQQTSNQAISMLSPYVASYANTAQAYPTSIGYGAGTGTPGTSQNPGPTDSSAKPLLTSPTAPNTDKLQSQLQSQQDALAEQKTKDAPQFGVGGVSPAQMALQKQIAATQAQITKVNAPYQTQLSAYNAQTQQMQAAGIPVAPVKETSSNPIAQQANDMAYNSQLQQYNSDMAKYTAQQKALPAVSGPAALGGSSGASLGGAGGSSSSSSGTPALSGSAYSPIAAPTPIAKPGPQAAVSNKDTINAPDTAPGQGALVDWQSIRSTLDQASQYQVGQATEQTQNSAAAHGMLGSGNTLAAINDRAQNVQAGLIFPYLQSGIQQANSNALAQNTINANYQSNLNNALAGIYTNNTNAATSMYNSDVAAQTSMYGANTAAAAGVQSANTTSQNNAISSMYGAGLQNQSANFKTSADTASSGAQIAAALGLGIAQQNTDATSNVSGAMLAGANSWSNALMGVAQNQVTAAKSGFDMIGS